MVYVKLEVRRKRIEAFVANNNFDGCAGKSRGVLRSKLPKSACFIGVPEYVVYDRYTRVSKDCNACICGEGSRMSPTSLRVNTWTQGL